MFRRARLSLLPGWHHIRIPKQDFHQQIFLIIKGTIRRMYLRRVTVLSVFQCRGCLRQTDIEKRRRVIQSERSAHADALLHSCQNAAVLFSNLPAAQRMTCPVLIAKLKPIDSFLSRLSVKLQLRPVSSALLGPRKGLAVSVKLHCGSSIRQAD